MKSEPGFCRKIIPGCLFLLCASTSWALNTCVSSGWWTNDAVWDGSQPTAGQDVYIPAGKTVIVSEATAALKSFTNSGVLIFTNWTTSLTASDVVVRAGGTITCAGPFSDTAGLSNRVWILCTNLVVETNGVIDVSRKGYAGGANDSNGKGPGAGAYVEANVGSGAGYGGVGGSGKTGSTAHRPNPGGYTYGAAGAPTAPGSGGAGGFYYATVTGGAGGGAIRVEAAGDITVWGSLRSDGGTGNFDGATSRCGGGGAGGAIYLSCRTLKGSTNGLISVQGGSSKFGGLGGGGRIAVVYDSAAQSAIGHPGVRFSASAGTTNLVSHPAYPLYGGMPGVGTLWVSDSTLLSTQSWQMENLCVVNPASWSLTGFELTNNTLGFWGTNLRFTVSNDLAIRAGGHLIMGDGAELDCRGGLTLDEGGLLSAYGGITNDTTAAYAGVIGVTGSVTLAAGAWIQVYSHPTNGGSPLFRMQSLTVATNAGFTAQGRGFAGGLSRGNGYGPGRGQGDIAGNAKVGGGYGGLGGNASGGYGQTYGVSNTPLHAGSGGGSDANLGHGGRGGGLIRLEVVQFVAMHGVLNADGVSGGNGSFYARCGSGGSGGGIFVQCNDFQGNSNAVITARGGSRIDTGRGGGGGRIAIAIGLTGAERANLLAGNPVPKMQTLAAFSRFAGATSVVGGTNSSGASGADGTCLWLWVDNPKGTIFIVR